VCSRSHAPAIPPITLVTTSGTMTRRDRSRCLRYAPVLAVTPTQSATVFVALAEMGATPVNIRAGKAMKLPPPATALSAPPRAPAKKRKIVVWIGKYQVYHNHRKRDQCKVIEDDCR
jgi:hypothetical protein